MAEKSEQNKADNSAENPHLAEVKGIIKNGVLDMNARLTLKNGVIVQPTRQGVRVGKYIEDNFQYPAVPGVPKPSEG